MVGMIDRVGGCGDSLDGSNETRTNNMRWRLISRTTSRKQGCYPGTNRLRGVRVSCMGRQPCFLVFVPLMPHHISLSTELHESHELQEPKRTPKNQKKQKETQETQDSARVASVLTLQQAVDIALRCKINRDTLFLYARAIRAVEVNQNRRFEEDDYAEMFDMWWLEAQARMPAHTDFRILFAKFKTVLRKTKSPLRIDPLEDAKAYALSRRFDETLGPKMGHLALVCERLQQLNGDNPFYLSFRSVGKLIESKDVYESIGAMEHLADVGIIERVRIGVGKKANEYRYLR